MKEIIKKIDSFTDVMEKFDTNSKTLQPIENLINWFIAIGVGLLLTIFSNIDKIEIEDKIPCKIFIIICFGLVSFGVLILSINRVILFFREYLILSSKAFFEKIKFKIEKFGKLDASDIKKFDRRYSSWESTVNTPNNSLMLLKDGLISIVIGVFVFIGYYIYIMIKFK